MLSSNSYGMRNEDQLSFEPTGGASDSSRSGLVLRRCAIFDHSHKRRLSKHGKSDEGGGTFVRHGASNFLQREFHISRLIGQRWPSKLPSNAKIFIRPRGKRSPYINASVWDRQIVHCNEMTWAGEVHGRRRVTVTPQGGMADPKTRLWGRMCVFMHNNDSALISRMSPTGKLPDWWQRNSKLKFVSHQTIGQGTEEWAMALSLSTLRSRSLVLHEDLDVWIRVFGIRGRRVYDHFVEWHIVFFWWRCWRQRRDFPDGFVLPVNRRHFPKRRP